MASYLDREGNAHHAASRAAVERYTTMLDGYARFSPAIADLLAAVLQLDPSMPMAHCMRGYLHLLAGKREMLGVAFDELRFLDSAGRALNGWEKAHRAALRAWCCGDNNAARRCWDDIVHSHPRDFLALKHSQFGHFYAGDAERMRDITNRAVIAWSANSPLYGFVQGVQAFGFEEVGDYGRAETLGRAAVAAHADDMWAVHAVAHCMEMQDRPDDGIVWLDAFFAQRPDGSLLNHLRWHKALMQLSRGDGRAVLADYDAGVFGNTVEYLDVCNDVALLARCELLGIDVGARWQPLLMRASARFDDHLMVFCDAHYVLAAAAAGDRNAVDQLLVDLGKHANDGSSDGVIVASVGLKLCAGIAAHGRRDFADAAALLNQVRYQLRNIGGSHAQRDVFHQLLIDASLRAGHYRDAQGLIGERLGARPGNHVGQLALQRLWRLTQDTATE